MIVTVCHHCQDRSIGCHDTCERYQAQRVEFEAEKAKRKKDKMVTDAIIDRVIETKRKGRKR